MSPPTSPSDNPAGPSDTSSDYTRLHITPFDQDLVKVIIPSSTLPKARNISYHTIETFPEKRYGYVELPEAEAEKIKKRLNGAVLKGTKMRIEKARPEENYLPVPGEEDSGKKKRKKSKEQEEGTKKKRKRDHNLVEGVELRDRKVKRGWTVPEEAKIREKKSKKEKGEKKDKKDKTKKREERSKYTDREECLLKTKLPAKLPSTKPAADGDEEEPEKKKRKKKSREVVIHEFEKTTKFPTFLKATKPAPAEALTTEFVEGKGWVDAEGNVIEPEKIRKTATAPVPESEAPKKKKKPAKAPTPPPQDDTTSSSGTSSEEDTSSDESSDEEEEEAKAKPVTPAKKTPEASKPPPQPVDDDTTSSSGSSSDEDSSDSDDEMEDADKITAPAVVDSPLAALKAADASRPRSSGSNVSLTIKIPPTTPAKVHPLEALYKRPKPDSDSTPQPAKEAQPFSFFGGGDNHDIEEDDTVPAMPQMPMTPFTEEEFAWRNVRSAAPTPDTAFPGRTKPFWAIGNEPDEEEEDDEATQQEIEATLNAEQNAVEGEGAGSGVPPGEFQKWFWENRRNLNQSWMKRRKTAAKEKRHRDNKSRASKAV
ncbi:hypothetical protein K4K49_006751 [Colletotrichum sp. SAR 10_70]|nr:hypothetical protein K4K50_005281 [Colletotrichum sp. SAR 10_71]KAI8190199.1 hypothetical protein K4K51_002737 [Colletotrichum sp. SAR 10_75]KAI8196330.1 hypothetical protein K4K49_006751 [Colletotrichum sp. SAR 10_70]